MAAVQERADGAEQKSVVHGARHVRPCVTLSRAQQALNVGSIKEVKIRHRISGL